MGTIAPSSISRRHSNNHDLLTSWPQGLRIEEKNDDTPTIRVDEGIDVSHGRPCRSVQRSEPSDQSAVAGCSNRDQRCHPQGGQVTHLPRTFQEVRYLNFMCMEHQEQQNQQTTIEELQRWKQLCHELADCLGCGCTIQHGLCVQCHKAQKRYRAIQIPLR